MKKTILLYSMLLTGMLYSQNLITNGDFEFGSSLSLPWNVTVGTPTIVSDNTGSGTTNVLNIPAGSFTFEQVFEVAPGVTYELSLKYNWATGGSSAGTFSTPLIRTELSGTTNIATTPSPIVETGTSGPGSINYDIWRARTVTFTVPANVFKARFYYTRGTAGAILRLDDIQIKVKPSITWDGSENDGDLGNAANWSTGILPTSTDVILIPSGLSSYPSTGNLTAKDIFIDHGATFITSGTVTGIFHAHVGVNDDKWHLISSAGTTQVQNNAWISGAGIASGNLNNRGISTYQNGTPDPTTGPWVYFQAGTTSNYDTTKGYSMKRLAPGIYTFNGSYNQAPASIPITQGSSNNWNLIANPFTSYLDISSFLSTNTVALTDTSEAVYVWNAGSSAYNALTNGYIHPGQAFFVNSALASTTISVTAAMQSHQSGVNFYKNSNTSIKLMLSDGNLTKQSEISYESGKTKGLDPRFDIGLFDGVESDLKLYTNLLEGYEGIAFMKQALPNTNLESLVVPIGIKAAAGKQISFSAEAMNLPEGIKVFLEDRQNNTITGLDEVNSKYTITLTEALDGIGRFYLHTKSSGVLSTEDLTTSNVNVYASSSQNLRIVGVNAEKVSLRLFNTLGKEVVQDNFSSKGVTDIKLPKLASGVYIVQISTQNAKVNKKIILE